MKKINNFKNSKLAVLRDYLQKIKIDLDANVLEFNYTIENYINVTELTKNENVNYLYDKSETLSYMEDFIHVMNVGKSILNSILGELEQQYLSNKKHTLHNLP